MIRVTVRVQPRASRNLIRVEPDGTYRAWVTAPPVDDAANEAVLALLASSLGVPRSRVRLVRGHASRTKVFEVGE